MDHNFQKLKYRLLEATTEDPDYPLYELLRGAESSGWTSVRFCTYPQEILLQFLTPVHLKRIHILSNEKKIASMVEIYSYYPPSISNTNSNYKMLPFDKLGYIRMDTNSKTNYKAREFRKIFVDTYCYYLKIVLNKNYVNKYNVFNQVGLISLDFYGSPVTINKNELYLKESNLIKSQSLNEEELDEISMEKLKIFKAQQEEALKVEDFDEAKRLKKSIDRIRMIGRKIYELEVQKKIYVNNEDFDNAKIMKLEIDRLKTNLKYIDKQLPSIVPYQNASMELNRSVEGGDLRDTKEFNDNKSNRSKDMIDDVDIGIYDDNKNEKEDKEGNDENVNKESTDKEQKEK